jgi:SNF2 family DNA or RNA helicase
MKSVVTGDSFKLIYSICAHPYLGYLIEPHVVLLNTNGALSFSYNRVFSNTIKDYNVAIDEKDQKIIALLDQIEQTHLIKKYHKKPIRPMDYFSKIFDPKIFEFLRPKIEQKLLDALELLLDRPLYLMSKDGYPADTLVQMATEPATVLFHFRRNEHETRYFPTIKYAGQRIEFMFRDAQILIHKQAWMLLDGTLYWFDQPLEGKKLTPFLQKRYIAVARSTEFKYFESFVCGLIEKHHVYAEGFDIVNSQAKDAQPLLKLKVNELGDSQLTLHFLYGQYEVSSEASTKVTVRMHYEESTDRYTFYRIKRSLLWEQKQWQELQDLGLRRATGLFGFLEQDPSVQPQIHVLDWLQKHQETLQSKGFRILQADQHKRYFLGKIDLQVTVEASNDWFDVHAMAKFGSFEIPFLQLKQHILQGKREFQLPNGEWAWIPEEWFAKYHQWFHFSKDKDSIRLHRQHIGLLSEESDHLQERMGRKLERLLEFDSMEEVNEPVDFKGQLRPYQKAGFNWFYFLKKFRFGGCLADDMGLGKTIQTLALLQKEKELALVAGETTLSLIVMPTSLIYNWQQEASKFAPNLRVRVHTGLQRAKDPHSFLEVDVILTTYGVVRSDEKLLSQIMFHYLILDESQHIKNASSKSFKIVRDLKATYRLALSGTPIENSVTDLWSQMAYLNPGLLGSSRYFHDEFVYPIEKKKDVEKAHRLQAIIKPFILRRTKQQVATELPPKSEQVIFCEMTESQQAYYERIKSEYRNTILEGLENQSPDAKPSPITLLQGLTKLRQLANHPLLIDEAHEGGSGKFDEVLHILDSVLLKGNKVLIFSQFVRQLHLFRTHFDQMSIPYAYLDGATRDRAAEVEKFRQDEEVRLFLISIKAGGVGLNLTEADYVFILDPWWNPAVEQQAIDRTHRIGQKRNVFIYKFITKDTVEEKILALQGRKQLLADQLITTEDRFIKSLTQHDIRELLK